ARNICIIKWTCGGLAATDPATISASGGRGGSTTVARGVVVLYFSRFGKPLQWHHRVVLEADAKATAAILGYKFAGRYERPGDHSDRLFFVPDDTLLVDEASYLGIRSAHDLYGGVAPYRFAKTKAITHELVDRRAERPQGWSTAFAKRVRGIVLPGYTAFSNCDARVAGERMLRRGPFRGKKPFSASRREQTLV